MKKKQKKKIDENNKESNRILDNPVRMGSSLKCLSFIHGSHIKYTQQQNGKTEINALAQLLAHAHAHVYCTLFST